LPEPSPPRPRKSKKKKPKIDQKALLELLKSDIPKEQKAIALAAAGLTPRQTATALAASEFMGHRSFGDRLVRGIGKGTFRGVSWTLDKLMRPSWSVTAATDEFIDEVAKKGADLGDIGRVARAAGRGFTGKERKGFGEVLDKHGVLKGHKFTRGAIGFGLDVVTDPIMLLSLGASIPTGGGATAAYLAAKTAGRAVTPKVVKLAAQEAGRKARMGATDDLTHELLKLGGEKFAHRRALLEFNKANSERPALGLTHEQVVALRSEEAILTSMAEKEALENDFRKIYLRYGTRKHHIKIPLGPRLARPGQKIARAGIPVISQLSDRLGRAFVPDWKNPIIRAGQLARQHVAEQNAVMQRQVISRIFNGVDETMDVDHFLRGLHYMEQPLKTKRGGTWKSVIPDKKGGYKLNEKYIELLKRRGLLDHSQEDAIRRFFAATEAMFAFDRAAGVAVDHFGATGRMYVPHIVKKDGESAVPTITQRGLLTEAGFQKHRKGSLSLLEIKKLVDEGVLPKDIETNPFRLLAHRSRAGAERQADMALINTLKASIGIPTRLVDEKAVARATKRQEAALAKHEAAMRAAAHAEEEYYKALDDFKERLAKFVEKGRKENAKTAKALRAQAKAAQIKKLEAAIKRAQNPRGGKPVNEARIAELQKEIRRVRASRISTPELVENEKQLKLLEESYKNSLKVLKDPRSKLHKKVVGEQYLALKTAREVMADAKKELQRANAAYKRAVNGKDNPAVKPDMHVDSRALDKYGHSFAFPQEAAQGFLRLERIVSGDDSAIEHFVRTFGKWQGAWKVLVTVVNPGYRIRNTMTDMWNMWLSGANPQDVAKYGVKAARIMKRASTGDPEAFFWVKEAADHGILAGLFAGDIAQVEKYFKYGGKTYRALRKDHNYISLVTKIMQDFNKSAENWGRLTHYMWRRQGLKETPGEAAMRVKLAHFDYEDLTPFEQKLRDTIFPFYTWTRKNIPYQVKKIFQEPGRYSAFPKLVQEATYAAGAQNQPVPEYVETGMGFPIGKNRYYLPQFGVSDLTVFQGAGEPFDRAFTMLTPAVKVPIELYLNKSFFTGQPIANERHPRAPVTPLGAKLLSLLPGSNVGPTKRQDITGPGANPYYAYLLSQIPALRLAGVVGPGSITAKRTGNAAITSWLGGQSVVSADPAAQAYFDSLAIQEKIDKMLQGLRDAGIMPVKKRKKSEVDKLIEKVLRG
jgi:hypothetical protein